MSARAQSKQVVEFPGIPARELPADSLYDVVLRALLHIHSGGEDEVPEAIVDLVTSALRTAYDGQTWSPTTLTKPDLEPVLVERFRATIAGLVSNLEKAVESGAFNHIGEVAEFFQASIADGLNVALKYYGHQPTIVFVAVGYALAALSAASRTEPPDRVNEDDKDFLSFDEFAAEYRQLDSHSQLRDAALLAKARQAIEHPKNVRKPAKSRTKTSSRTNTATVLHLPKNRRVPSKSDDKTASD